jgi:hypothetical protein
MDEISDTTPWRKASASTGTGGCLEFRRRNRRIELRDSKLGDEGVIGSFNRYEIECFLLGREGNEFADLLDRVD